LASAPGEAEARSLVETMARLLQASVLLRAGHAAAGTFCRSRLGERASTVFGSLPADAPFEALLARADAASEARLNR
ncbi:MAG: hypothetical protein KA124_06090, partial [Luteimonas sp.]|nr:hypothetical protein [Luteimonas sp.]